MKTVIQVVLQEVTFGSFFIGFDELPRKEKSVIFGHAIEIAPFPLGTKLIL